MNQQRLPHRIPIMQIEFADDDGPWCEDMFTTGNVRRFAASKRKTLPDLIKLETVRDDTGWTMTVYEVDDRSRSDS